MEFSYSQFFNFLTNSTKNCYFTKSDTKYIVGNKLKNILNMNFAKILTVIVSLILLQFSSSYAKSKNDIKNPYQAPEIVDIAKWFNSKPTKLKNLKGKVVLLEFWTFSCVNCIRGLPHINKIHEKYSKDGLVVIGIHSPEFNHEKDPRKVRYAIDKYGIKYPVALDNKETNWDNYKTKYWPSYYLINKDGKVVYEHFGEGGYGILEGNIKHLLKS